MCQYRLFRGSSRYSGLCAFWLRAIFTIFLVKVVELILFHCRPGRVVRKKKMVVYPYLSNRLGHDLTLHILKLALQGMQSDLAKTIATLRDTRQAMMRAECNAVRVYEQMGRFSMVLDHLRAAQTERLVPLRMRVARLYHQFMDMREPDWDNFEASANAAYTEALAAVDDYMSACADEHGRTLSLVDAWRMRYNLEL